MAQDYVVQIHHSFNTNHHVQGIPRTKEFTTANAHHKYGSPYPIKHTADEKPEVHQNEQDEHLVVPASFTDE